MCQNYENDSKKQKKHQKWTKSEKENFLSKKISSEEFLFFSEIFLFLQRFFSFSLDICLFHIFLSKSTEMKSTYNFNNKIDIFFLFIPGLLFEICKCVVVKGFIIVKVWETFAPIAIESQKEQDVVEGSILDTFAFNFHIHDV